MSYAVPYIPFSQLELVHKSLKESGVVVVTDVFTLEEAHAHRNKIIQYLQDICPELKERPAWKHLPQGPRKGLIQSLVTVEPVTSLRQDPRVYELWKHAYNDGRRTQGGFVQSCDGINVWPGDGRPRGKDWPHLDQTESDRLFECVQGQIVLNESTACFRCTPGSHRLFSEIRDITEGKDDWNKFSDSEVKKVKALLRKSGVTRWQERVFAAPGSIILWLSTTIHSAAVQDPDAPKRDRPYDDWRCVVYTCLRPRREVSENHLKRLKKCYDENRCTNHWGSRLFPKTFRWGCHNQPPTLKKFQDDPALVYKQFPEYKPRGDPFLQKTCALDKFVARDSKRRRTVKDDQVVDSY